MLALLYVDREKKNSYFFFRRWWLFRLWWRLWVDGAFLVEKLVSLRKVAFAAVASVERRGRLPENTFYARFSVEMNS